MPTIMNRCTITLLRRNCNSIVFPRDVISESVLDMDIMTFHDVVAEIQQATVTAEEDVVETRIVFNNKDAK